MTTVRVHPGVVNACDIVEYARALIVEHGWRQGPRVPNTEEWDKVAKNGLSLHDAIGMACYRLSGEVGTQASPPRAASSHSKEFPVATKAGEFGYTSSLRNDATGKITKHIPRTRTDIQFNDDAKNVGEVLALLDTVMKEECGGNHKQ